MQPRCPALLRDLELARLAGPLVGEKRSYAQARAQAAA